MKKEKETLIFQIKLSFVVSKLLKVILKNLFGKLSVNCQLKSITLKLDSIFPQSLTFLKFKLNQKTLNSEK